jgi:hypothetical protein
MDAFRTVVDFTNICYNYYIPLVPGTNRAPCYWPHPGTPYTCTVVGLRVINKKWPRSNAGAASQPDISNLRSRASTANLPLSTKKSPDL